MISLFCAMLLVPGILFLWNPKKWSLQRRKTKLIGDDVSLSIIIPARNEEKNLERLLSSLELSTLRPLEIIVVDDDSNDGTSNVAERFNTKLLRLVDKPSGWLGKSYACHIGAQAAQGSHFVFLDADVTIHPNFFETLLGNCTENPGVYSVQPFHAIEEKWENFASLLNLMVVAGISNFGYGEDGNSKSGAYGPCQLFEAKIYNKLLPHENAREVILEDVKIGQQVSQFGFPMYNRLGGNLLQFRMYSEGFSEMTQGFAKGFAQGANATPPIKMLYSVLWLIGAIQITSLVLFSPSIMAILVYLAFAFQFHSLFKAIGKFHILTALLFPIPIFYFFYVQALSWWQWKVRKTTTWKGRSIHV